VPLLDEVHRSGRIPHSDDELPPFRAPERGRPELDEHGAGLGLYLVLANVASLIVNVDPGRRTEVVCLFDRSAGDRRAIESGVRSLHVFT